MFASNRLFHLSVLCVLSIFLSACIVATVPDLSGLTEETAINALADAGLLTVEITYENSDTVAAGELISQSPEAGTSVASNSSVSIVISLGPLMVSVPNVVGLTEQGAETILGQEGLSTGSVTEEFSNEIIAGRVISQSPVFQTEVLSGSSVDIIISLGSDIVSVPDVTGLSQSNAETDITSAGLTLGTVTQESSLTIPAGEVIGQSPEAATDVVSESAVNITVSSGLPVEAVDIPAMVNVGELLVWGAITKVGDRLRSTVFDADGNVVFHRGFDTGNFSWTPFMPGEYDVEVEFGDENGVLSRGAGSVTVVPRGTQVTLTQHPLVAFYTFQLPEGLRAKVEYTCESCPPIVNACTFMTPYIEREGGGEVGTLLPALRPDSDYSVEHLLYSGEILVSRSDAVNFTSGSIPVEVNLIDVNVVTPVVNPGVNSIFVFTHTRTNLPLIVDQYSTPLWYHPDPIALCRPTGTGWAVLDSINHFAGEVDYSGQYIRQVSWLELTRQESISGLHKLQAYHHEMMPLPGNRYATYGKHEIVVEDLQGPGLQNVVADKLIVLNDEMQIVWSWDAAENLDLSRIAFGNEQMLDGVFNMELDFDDSANNWNHCNAIEYDPRDGNLLLSIRNQSWIVKIAYEDGEGDGHVIWRLGFEGDFSIESANPFPWFSYQHDPNILQDGRLTVYDNGNYRINNSIGNQNSRGQVYILDEVNMEAVLDVNIDLGSYAQALGSSNQNPDDSFHFNTGFLMNPDRGISDDVDRDGNSYGTLQSSALVYRSFVLKDPFDISGN